MVSGSPMSAPRIESAPCELVAITASAGGLRALIALLSGLPADFPAPIAVVQHLDPHHESLLVPILARHTPLRMLQAEQAQRIEAGSVYVAPPDHHLLFSDRKTIQLTQTTAVHFVRPSADVLFESAAERFGPLLIAVILTGIGLDGAKGVRAVKRGGGRIIAQDPATSEFTGMPEAAVRTGDVDHVVALEEIAPLLSRLVRRPESS
jgi:two-component system chemotaxis response regulator CheB